MNIKKIDKEVLKNWIKVIACWVIIIGLAFAPLPYRILGFIIFIAIYGIVAITKFVSKINNAVILLNGLSDDINEIRMKLGLGMVQRTEIQIRRDIREATERCLVHGNGIEDIEEIKNYIFPKFEYSIDDDSEKSRRKHDKFIRELIKDFDEAKICPQCKKIYYAGRSIFPDDYCLECGHDKRVELIKAIEYRQRIKDSKAL